jgi:hypothetical protein
MDIANIFNWTRVINYWIWFRASIEITNFFLHYFFLFNYGRFLLKGDIFSIYFICYRFSFLSSLNNSTPSYKFVLVNTNYKRFFSSFFFLLFKTLILFCLVALAYWINYSLSIGLFLLNSLLFLYKLIRNCFSFSRSFFLSIIFFKTVFSSCFP